MKKVSKIITGFLAFLLVVSSLELFSIGAEKEKNSLNNKNANEISIYNNKYKDISIKLAKRLKKYPKTVDVSDLIFESGLSIDEFSKQVIKNIANVDADMYGFGASYSIQYSQDKKIVKLINIEYMDSYEQHLELMEKADKIISMMPKNLTDAQKVLWIHNYIIFNASYDIESWKKIGQLDKVSQKVPESRSFGPYGVLIDGKGVCESYTKAFNMLMKRLNIESYRVSNSAMVHSWNIVKLNGKWYNIDLTWDDPIGIGKNQISYLYFLKSDKKMYENSIKNNVKHRAAEEKIGKIKNTEWDKNIFDSNIAFKPEFIDGKFIYKVAGKLNNIDKTVDIYVYNVDKNMDEKQINRAEGVDYSDGKGKYIFKFDLESRNIKVYKYSNLSKPISQSKKIGDLKEVQAYRVDKDIVPMNNYMIKNVSRDKNNKLNIKMLKMDESLAMLDKSKYGKYIKEENTEIYIKNDELENEKIDKDLNFFDKIILFFQSII